MAPPALLVESRYQLNDRIAVGGMGEVWRASDLVLERPVAVKLLRPGCAQHEQDRARFRSEAPFNVSWSGAAIYRGPTIRALLSELDRFPEVAVSQPVR